MNPKVAIILINYNTYDDTLECIKSLKKIDYDNYFIILVDNNSRDKERLSNSLFIKSNCDLVLSPINNGFSYGNNIGIEYAKKYNPDYYLLLNNDTIVESDFLNILVNVAETNSCGLLTGQTRFYSAPEKIDFRGGTYNRIDGYARYNNPLFRPEDVSEITFASGCILLIPKKTIETVGKLNEDYFMYGEDVDYSNKVIDAGLKILYCDNAIIYHKISSSAGNRSAFKHYYITRNALINIRKYCKCKPYAYLKHLYGDLLEGSKIKKGIKVTFRAWLDFLLGRKGKTERTF